MCEIDFDESCDVFVEKTQTAKKKHQCDSCGTMIVSGEKYLRNFNVFDGQATSEKACMPCVSLRDRFAKEHKTGFVPSYLPFALDECVDGGDEGAWKWAIARHRMRKRAERRAKTVIIEVREL